MERTRSLLAVLGLCITVAACQPQPHRITGKDDLLAAAGFRILPADTPLRQTSLRQLPPHVFSRLMRDGRAFYVYPDPTGCACLYVGDQTAYASYRKSLFDKQFANEQSLTPNEVTMSWDWGPWGG